MNPLLGQIQAFGFNFAPRAWAKCDGALLPISQNTALFSLLGTIYGGDGRTTFSLPDLRGRAMLHQGTGPGLTPVRIGQKGGAETVTLVTANLPSHTHGVAVPVTSNDATGDEANGQVLGTAATNIYAAAPTGGQSLQGFNTQNTGASSPVNIMAPYLVVNYCIALQGIYPSRS